jgi:hypothetical protein
MFSEPAVLPHLEQILEDLPQRVRIPSVWPEFFEQTGPMMTIHDDRRLTPRFYYRGWAVAEIDGEQFAVPTKDISCGGISFLHHEQFAPLEQIEVSLPCGICASAQVTRSMQIEDDCYDVGARWVNEEDRQAITQYIAEFLDTGSSS